MTLVKICGVNSPRAAAATQGADFVGFIFASASVSVRRVSVEQAVGLCGALPSGMRVVAVCVDPEDDLLEAICSQVRPHMIQLHGQESPARVAEVRHRTRREVIKAVRVGTKDDVRTSRTWGADVILFEGPARGESFDWDVLAQLPSGMRWGLAGGLTPETVGDAIRTTGAPFVDVSSGVESAPGCKDPERVAAFIRCAKSQISGRLS